MWHLIFALFFNLTIIFRYVTIYNLDVECSFHRRVPASGQRGRSPGTPGDLGQEGALLRRRGDRGGQGDRGHGGRLEARAHAGHAGGPFSEEKRQWQ